MDCTSSTRSKRSSCAVSQARQGAAAAASQANHSMLGETLEWFVRH